MTKQYTVTVDVEAALALEKFEQVRAAFDTGKMKGMSTGDEVRLHFADKPEVADLQAIQVLFPGAMVTLDSEEVEDDPAVHQKKLLTGTLKGFWDATARYVLEAEDPEKVLGLIASNHDEADEAVKAQIAAALETVLAITEKIHGGKKSE